MLICMRTTLNLADGLVVAAKERAAATGRTLTSLVEEGLRAVLETAAIPPDVRPLPSFGVEGGTFAIDLFDKEALWEALDTDGAR